MQRNKLEADLCHSWVKAEEGREYREYGSGLERLEKQERCSDLFLRGLTRFFLRKWVK